MARTPVFRGTAPALVTPFTPDGSAIDEPAFRRLLDDVIAGGETPGHGHHAGVEAVVVMGTTGENPTVTAAERQRLVELCVEHVAGRVPVVVGAGTNDTAQSVGYARAAAAAGADGLLVVSPYYNKPTPAGLIAHVSAIAEATDCPIIFYNVPGRTGQNVRAETQLALADAVETVVGTKEASGDLNQIADILAGRPAGFAVYAGDDDLALPTLALGADGLISVCANAVPGATAELVRLSMVGDLDGARSLHFLMLDAMRASFAEASPTPIKAVLAAMGRMDAAVRLPLVCLSDGAREAVLSAYTPFIATARVPA
ncbi:MAG TPA: 4-hydroxy-tetrahydrodipicolinate synthase [Rubricoccaceae bacterium]|jgi:4-hydroxy-tetrahydrodipicolinate synthase